MKVIKVLYHNFWKDEKFSYYLYGWNPIKKQCLYTLKESSKFGFTCNQVFKLDKLPQQSEWHIDFLPLIASTQKVNITDLSVKEKVLQKAPVPLVVFTLDLNVSFSFWLCSRLVLCCIEYTNNQHEFSIENLHYLFNLHHQRSLYTNSDNYHYSQLKVLQREDTAMFYKLDHDDQVWDWMKKCFENLVIYQSCRFCPKLGFDLVIEEIFQRWTDQFPVLARIKECRSLPEPQTFVIVMRAVQFYCSFYDVFWWFGKDMFVFVLSIDQGSKVEVPVNETWRVEKISISLGSMNVFMNRFQYYCLLHLLELSDVKEIQPLNDFFDINGYYKIKVFST